MSQKVNQKEYLRKYLGKHNKKKSRKSNRTFNDETEDYLELSGEDAPQIVEIVDETKNSCIFKSSHANEKWKRINIESSIADLNNTDTEVENMRNYKDKYSKMNLVFANTTSKKKNSANTDQELNEADIAKNGGSDLSPPRKSTLKTNSFLNLDLSPPRKGVNSNNEVKVKIENFKRCSPVPQITDISKKENNEFSSTKKKKYKVAENVSHSEPVVHESTNKYAANSGNTVNKTKELEKTEKLYREWGKGIRQVENYREQNGRNSYECGKPLARYSNDKDLDNFLKERDRHGDPMLTYINKKCTKNVIKTEVYKGFAPENRFDIRPGYRWDGVNRSNGYEKKFFDQQSKRKLELSDAYAFGSEDL